MVRAVAFLHEKRVMHRSITPAKFLLVTRDPLEIVKLKLIDFMRAAYFEEEGKPLDDEILLRGDRLVHPEYIAPEVKKIGYTEKVDIWSLGVVTHVYSNSRLERFFIIF